MATIDRSFVDGVFWRMLGLGALAALVGGLAFSVRFGYSVAMGAAVGALSLRVTAIAVQRMMRGAQRGQTRSVFWALVLTVKLAALFMVVVVVLVFLNAHAVAFVLGFKMILPALAWQAFRASGLMVSSDDNADDTESS